MQLHVLPTNKRSFEDSLKGIDSLLKIVKIMFIDYTLALFINTITHSLVVQNVKHLRACESIDRVSVKLYNNIPIVVEPLHCTATTSQRRSVAASQRRSGAVAQRRSGAAAQWRSGAAAQRRSGAAARELRTHLVRSIWARFFIQFTQLYELGQAIVESEEGGTVHTPEIYF